MRTAIPILIAALVGSAAITTVSAREPSGSVDFGGTGATLLPAARFDPTTFEDQAGVWVFFDASINVGIAVWPLEADSAMATEVEVSEDGGESWEAIGQTGPVPGVSIEDGVVKFIDVVVPRSDEIGPWDLILDGVLGRNAGVGTEPASVGRLKGGYADDR